MASLLEKSEVDTLERPPFPVRRWTVSEYRRLAEAGFLTEDDRVELLEGWIVPRMTHNPPHVWAVSKVERLLKPMIGDQWYIRVQSPIETADSEPEPDIAVVRGDEDDYFDSHPTSDDIGIVVEVSDSSLMKDRRKIRVYSGAMIPEYWIINLAQGTIERFFSPDAAKRTYLQSAILQKGDELPVPLAGVETGRIKVSELLPP